MIQPGDIKCTVYNSFDYDYNYLGNVSLEIRKVQVIERNKEHKLPLKSWWVRDIDDNKQGWVKESNLFDSKFEILVKDKLGLLR